MIFQPFDVKKKGNKENSTQKKRNISSAKSNVLKRKKKVKHSPFKYKKERVAYPHLTNIIKATITLM
jgi:hypothetical protein